MAETPGNRMSIDQPLTDQHAVFFAQSPSTDSPSTAKQSESPGSTPAAISAGSTTTATPPDTFHQDKSPSRALSTTSSTKSSKRRSWASVITSLSAGISSLARTSSSASSKGVNVNASGANTALSKLSREEFLAMLQEKPRKATKGKSSAVMGGLFNKSNKYSTANPTDKELNHALFRMCCVAYVGRETDCVHDRLAKAIDAQKSEGRAFTDFRITEEEANMVDEFGNSLLHVAARWRARVSILLLIIKYTDDVQVVNHRGETFLHVFDPPEDPRMRPVSFIHLIRTLRSRGYDFCQRDVNKCTFLPHFVAKEWIPTETLYHVFREVGHGAARFLVANKSADGERLWHIIRRNLNKTCPKLHRIFGDEVEFIRRYLPEFSSQGKAPSTADTSTLGSDSLLSIHPTEAAALNLALDPNDSNAQKVRRSPLMKVLRRAAGGRGMSDAELTTKLESIFEAEVTARTQELEKQGYREPKPELNDQPPPHYAWETALVLSEFRRKLDAGEIPDPDDAEKFGKPRYPAEEVLSRRDTEGNSALHYASEFGLVPAVEFFCAKGASVNVFNNCGNTPLQLVKFAIQRTDVRCDIHMEARYLRCAVLLLEQGAHDKTKLVSERSHIFPYDVFDGSERRLSNLMQQGVATQCRGLHLLTSSAQHHGPGYSEGLESQYCQHGHGPHDYHHHGHGHGGMEMEMGMLSGCPMTFQTSVLASPGGAC